MVCDHGNHKSRHLDRVAYMAIYGVPVFDNFDSQYFDPESKKRYRTKISCYPVYVLWICTLILGSTILLYYC